ncbi:hypothetical protein ACWIUD_06760 [Helicobacter sp. 23-1044]
MRDLLASRGNLDSANFVERFCDSCENFIKRRISQTFGTFFA